MRAFVSHAWKSKVTQPNLPRLLTYLEEDLGLELWKDNERLDARIDNLDSALAKAISECDLFLLLWTRDAAASEDVGYEIRTAAAAKKPIVVCRFDDTDITRNELLKGRLYIDFMGDGTAFFMAQRELSLAIANPLESAVDKATSQNFQRFKGFIGALDDYVGTRRAVERKSDRRGTLLRALNKALSLTAEGATDEDARVLRVFKPLLERFDRAAGNPHELRAVLQETTKLGASSNPMVALLSRKLREEIETELAEAGGGSGPPPAHDAAAIAASAQRYEHDVRSSARNPVTDIRASLQGHFPEAHIDLVAALVHEYVATSPVTLQWLVTGAQSSGIAALIVLAQRLVAYFDSPNDLIPDSYGALGKLDDAWLIHNTVAACSGAGFLDVTTLPVDWARIGQANTIVEQRLLPGHLLRSLAAIRGQILSECAGSIPGYGDPLAGAFGGAAPAYPVQSGGAAGGDFESLRDELAPSLGGMFLKYGV